MQVKKNWSTSSSKNIFLSLKPFCLRLLYWLIFLLILVLSRNSLSNPVQSLARSAFYNTIHWQLWWLILIMPLMPFNMQFNGGSERQIQKRDWFIIRFSNKIYLIPPITTDTKTFILNFENPITMNNNFNITLLLYYLDITTWHGYNNWGLLRE
jgi:hypothetical protein